MKTNDDQWFQPGDKVMRVAYASQFGLSGVPGSMVAETDFSKVLCVENCWQGRNGVNRVSFVGVPTPIPGVYWAARCFRKVEEIKLCIGAVERAKSPTTKEAFA